VADEVASLTTLRPPIDSIRLEACPIVADYRKIDPLVRYLTAFACRRELLLGHLSVVAGPRQELLSEGVAAGHTAALDARLTWCD
jgi:hypothetical protein